MDQDKGYSMQRHLIRITLAALFASLAAPVPVVSGQGDGHGLGGGPNAVRYDDHLVVRTTLTNREQLKTILAISPDVWSEGIGLGQMDFRIPQEKLDELKRSGIPYQILINDVQQLIERSREGGAGDGQPGGGGWFTQYHTYEDINLYMETLAGLEPDVAEVFTLGESLQGRDIRGIRIGTGVDRPILLIQGCQHAREWISPATCMFLADRLLRNYGSNGDLQALLDRVELVIVPIVNPDGYVYSWTTDRLWRKNRRDNGGGRFGVDLNRNWGFEWGGSGSSGDPSSEIYRGPAPFSEPETQIMRDFMLANPRIAFHLDVHSYSQLILSPWAYTTNLPVDIDLFNELGAAFQSLIASVHGSFYEYGPTGTVLYLAAGSAPDWSYDMLDVPAYTFELRDTGQFGFLLPPEQIIPTGEEIAPTLTFMLEWLARVIDISFPNGQPDVVEPGISTTITVEVEAVNGATLDEGSLALVASVNGGPFESTPLTPLGAERYEAILPAAACGSTIAWYIIASTTEDETVTAPSNAPDDFFTVDVRNRRVILSDNFENDLGWTVDNVAVTGGAWARGTPIGGGDRGDPVTDFDGSGQCFATDPLDGNTDLDGGPTILTSPPIDLSDAPDAVVSYARWFYNDDGDDDRLRIEVSDDDGATWTLVESVADTGVGGWVEHSFRVTDFVTPGPRVRVRFSAIDNPNNSVTEAAIDAFSVEQLSCGGTTLLTADALFGSVIAGGVDQLRLSDDDVMRLQSQFGFSANEPNIIDLGVDAETTVPSPSVLDIRIESRLNNTGGQVRVRLRDFDAGVFVQVDSYPLGQSEVVHETTGVDATTFVRGSDGRVSLSLRHSVIATFTASGFEAFVDHVSIDVH